MRITEVINPDINNRRFSHTQKIGEFTYTARARENNRLNILVRNSDNKIVGEVEFVKNGNALTSLSTWVHKDYREQGIATTMYAYAKMLGNDVEPHPDQTDDGKRMWRAWNQSKQSKHILPKGHKGHYDVDENIK